MKRQGTMHSSRAGLSPVRGPIRSTSDRFTEQGVKQGLIEEPGRSQCCVQLRGLAGWKGLLSAVCLSLLSLLLAKSNFCYKLGSGTAVSRFPCSRQLVLDKSDRVFIIWSKRIRTFACRYQKPMPYHLAILHTACFRR